MSQREWRHRTLFTKTISITPDSFLKTTVISITSTSARKESDPFPLFRHYQKGAVLQVQQNLIYNSLEFEKIICYSVPKGWYKGNQKCIRYINKTLTYEQAKTTCAQFGGGQGDILSIHTQREQDFVTALTAGQKPLPWIGFIHMQAGIA